MYARETPFLVITVLLFSSFSGMVSGSSFDVPERDSGQSDEESSQGPNWNAFEDPVGYIHQIKQSSELIISPFGSFDPLDQ